jgi:hypothetical protein
MLLNREPCSRRAWGTSWSCLKLEASRRVPKLDPRVRGPYPGTSSRGLAVVEAEKSTKPIAADDFPCAVHGIAGHDQRVVEPLMVPFLVIVLNELSDRPAEMAFAEGHYPVQAFLFLMDSTNRSANAFRFGLSAGNRITFTAPCFRIPGRLPCTADPGR